MTVRRGRRVLAVECDFCTSRMLAAWPGHTADGLPTGWRDSMFDHYGWLVRDAYTVCPECVARVDREQAAEDAATRASG